MKDTGEQFLIDVLYDILEKKWYCESGHEYQGATADVFIKQFIREKLQDYKTMKGFKR